MDSIHVDFFLSLFDEQKSVAYTGRFINSYHPLLNVYEHQPAIMALSDNYLTIIKKKAEQ